MVFDFSKIGGDEEDRTLDLTDANRTLSQTVHLYAQKPPENRHSYAEFCHKNTENVYGLVSFLG